MRLFRFVFVLILWFSCGHQKAAGNQILRYGLYKDGREVGEIKTKKYEKDGQVIYEVQTSMTIKVLMTQKIEYSSTSSFHNGILIKSIAKSFFNEKEHHYCITKLAAGHNKYEITQEDGTRFLSGNITYCGSMLYFQEPGNQSKVYSEMAGQINTVRNIKDGHYVMTDSKSRKQNNYWYKDGILEKASIRHTLLELEVRRKH